MSDTKQLRRLFIELVGMQGSGFIKDGTAGTPHQEELKAPTMCFIPVTGYRKVQRDGKPVNEPIRYIKNCPTIVVAEQERMGIKPNRYEDIIQIEKGYATVLEEDGDPALCDYFEQVYYNENAPGRSNGASPLFRIINIDEKSQQFVDNEIAWLEAGAYLSALREKTKTGYKFNEDKLDSIITLLQIPVEQDTPTAKFAAVMSAAKQLPVQFMQRVTKLEENTILDVTHAQELNVISWKGNTAFYVENDEVIHNFGTRNIKPEKKVEMLATYFTHPDHREKFDIFRAKLAYAKEKELETT